MVWSNRLGHPTGRWPKIFLEATILPVRIPEAVSTLYCPLRLLFHPPFTCKRALQPPFSLPSITGPLHACVGGKQSVPRGAPTGGVANRPMGLLFPDGRVLGGRRDTYLSMGEPFLTCVITLVPTGAPIHLPLPFWIGPATRCAGFLCFAAHPGP